MLAVTGACMVLAAGCSIVGLVMGLRILCQEGDSRGRTTSAIFFLCEGGEETAPRTPCRDSPAVLPGNTTVTSQGLLNTLHSGLPRTRQKRPWSPKPQSPGSSRPSALGLTLLHPPSVPFPPGFCFLLADMIMQISDAISGFPVCL
ncbi:claudin domain-containing protein 2 isoform X1 [Neophocaena asiaeorientalis asiaeorientalis]|uniref:Claudin domain-containing protein 2 isoform X1 n=1 Tax=Neophocaena asiaeorientalis asiaeorientalis TaxID=1706337 RepID=A0A341DDZ9_NEOAA|nr:claudin domain-containing protein 2 isoform X1 [Neophocaena asiaeorientalis asiaeorientalis]